MLIRQRVIVGCVDFSLNTVCGLGTDYKGAHVDSEASGGNCQVKTGCTATHAAPHHYPIGHIRLSALTNVTATWLA